MIYRVTCQMGTCELNENNIVSSDRNTQTAGACQDKCVANPDCHWFTHYDTSCYLLDHCGTLSKYEHRIGGYFNITILFLSQL